MSSPKLAAFTIVMVCFQFTLAVLGAGGLAAYFSHPARTALAAITVALAIASLFTSGNVNPGEREDRANRWVLPAFGTIMILTAYLPAYTDRRDFWTFDGELCSATPLGGLQDTLWAAVLAWRWRKLTSVRSTSAKPAPPS